MINLQHVLLPTDLSQQAEAATPYALELARTFKAKLHLLHVVEEPAPYTYVFVDYKHERKQLEELARDKLDNWVLPNEEDGLEIERRVSFGSPFQAIIEDAKQHKIDLIVMGTHGRSAIPHLIMGSVAENVVRKALCPVLTARPAQHQFVMP